MLCSTYLHVLPHYSCAFFKILTTELVPCFVKDHLEIIYFPIDPVKVFNIYFVSHCSIVFWADCQMKLVGSTRLGLIVFVVNNDNIIHVSYNSHQFITVVC